MAVIDQDKETQEQQRKIIKEPPKINIAANT